MPAREAIQLDALRGLSAIGVAVGHANQFIVGATTMAGSTAFGLLAQGSVMVFFVLSGFLIGKSICRNIESSGGDRFALGRYAADRFWRIYPPLLFAVALMFAISIIAPHVFPSGTTQFLHPTNDYGRHGINFDWNPVLQTLLFRNGFAIGSPDMNGPLWSLSVEVWYYIIAGGAVVLLGRPFVAFFFAVLVVRLLGRNDDFTDFAAIWIAGYVLSIAHNRGDLRPAFLGVGFALSAVAAVVFGWLFAFPELSPGTNWIRHYNVAVGFAFAFGLGGIIGGYVSLPKLVTKVFSGASKYSYTLYLIHVPIYLLLFGIFEPHFVGNLPLTIATAGLGMAVAMLTAKAAASIVENKRLLQKPFRPKTSVLSGG